MEVGTAARAVAVVLISTACSDGTSAGLDGAQRLSAQYRDTTEVAASLAAEKQIVLRARAFDRADQLDSARILYEEAARRVPFVGDWLYLRAAGVSRSESNRERYFDKLDLKVALDRRATTTAIAMERAGDVDGAIAAYTEAGDKLSALRMRMARPDDSARVRVARRELVQYLSGNPGRENLREAVALFDKLFVAPEAAEHLALARAAFSAGLASRALTGYSSAFAASLGTGRDRFDAATMLARLNRDADAAAAFARVASPETLAAAARYQGVRALLAMGRREEGRRALRQLTTDFPRDSSAASALLLLSDLATDDLRDADARTTLLTIVDRFPRARHAPVALFRAGLIAYVQGNYRAAAAELDSVVRLYPRSDEVLAAGYWSGRAWKQRGDSGAANARWRAVLAREGGSYYSVQSAKRLGVPLFKDARRTNSYPSSAQVDASIRRIVILRNFGMDTEAKFEYDRLFRDAALTPERLVATAHALSGTDQASRAIALGRRAVNELGPTAQNYRLMYPVVERKTLIQASRANGLDPVLVAALIRQESSFNPLATSPVGARGLMQLMPDVGRSLARSRKIAGYTDESLYDASVNIRLGTQHLSGLLRRTAQVERVLAAYNAGESRVSRWIRKAGAGDPELFTERIPFVETRDYVRSVVRNRAIYGLLYDWGPRGSTGR